jgi:hypothetical protein
MTTSMRSWIRESITFKFIIINSIVCIPVYNPPVTGLRFANGKYWPVRRHYAYNVPVTED